ncbi:hypothetical protein G3M48_007215 [Beauveria asiatica]|uniref:Uncharacterized protein n=1 Tax=Beauveria asiatica TaxID=1069075 RepID=A0AAW0S479_9HYPO
MPQQCPPYILQATSHILHPYKSLSRTSLRRNTRSSNSHTPSTPDFASQLCISVPGRVSR